MLKKKTKPRQKKPQLHHSHRKFQISALRFAAVHLDWLNVCFSLWHRHLCVRIFLSTLCPELVTLEATLHRDLSTARLTWYKPAADSDWCWAPALSSHRTAPWAALLCSCSTALSPERFESLQGRFVAVGRSLSRSGSICVWSLPGWQCNAVLCYKNINMNV